MSKIRDARKAAGLTQAEMARQMGIPLRTIQNWESGSRHPAEWAERLVVAELGRMTK